VHTLEIVLLLVLLLALVVDGVLLVRRLRPESGRGLALRVVALLLTLVAVVLVGGFVVVLARSDSGGATPTTINGSAKLQQRIISDLQRYYYKPVDPAKLQRVAGTSAIDAMLKTLKDPYTEYMDPKETSLLEEQTKGVYSGIGAILEKKAGEVRITRVIEGSPAAEAHLQSADVIVSVDGRATKGEPIEVVSSRIKGKAGTQVRLAVRRPSTGEALSLTMTRRVISFPITSSRLIDYRGVKVGYVQLSEFSSGAAEKVRAALQTLQQRGAQQIVFDLRYNGGGLLDEGVGVASDFLHPGLVVVTTQGIHSPKEVFKSSGVPATTLPVVVLVNHWTASASEIVSGALQDLGRATIIGTPTFGKGLVQNIIALPGGASLKLTTAVYLTPRGTDINHVGIVPSISVKDDPKTKRDEALQRVLRFIATGR
jgi:carboxyl-terminal processing protease